MDRQSAEHARRQIVRHCHEGLDVARLARAFTDSIREVISFDGWCWHTIDPATSMLTSAIRPDFESEPRFARYEYTVPDVNRFAHLARSRRTAALLSEATHGMLSTSARYRDLLRPRGIEHELRASFVSDGSCWAACALYRKASTSDFSVNDADFLSSLSKLVAEGFKRSLLLADVTNEPAAHGPGLVLLDDADEVQSLTSSAEGWILDLVDVGLGTRDRLPSPFYAVAAHARALADGSDDVDKMAYARVITRSGRWVTLHASRLTGRSEPLTAVIIEPAQAAEIAPLIVRAYGFTERERGVAQLVLQGFSTREIAERLHLSPLTVQDYLKSIFEKSGVRSRRELVARIFLDHYAPRVARKEFGNKSSA